MVMRLPRPASPRAFWADLKGFFGDRPRHQWVALGLALLVPLVIGVTFMFDMRNAQTVAPKVIYVESWRADRSLAETQANVRETAARIKAFREERQRQFREFDNALTNHGF